MSGRESADARAALMATYIAQHPHPQAGAKKGTRSYPLQRQDTNVPARRENMSAGSQPARADGDRFAARGRTIYNAWIDPAAERYRRGCSGRGRAQKGSWSALEELRRIDAEEERRQHGVGGAREEMAESDRREEEVEVEEMFELYIRADWS